MKMVSIVALAVLAALSAVIAYGPLSNLWGYQDGSTATYLLFGLPPLLISITAVAALVVVATRRW